MIFWTLISSKILDIFLPVLIIWIFNFSGFTWKEKTWNPNLISIQTRPRPRPSWSLWSMIDAITPYIHLVSYSQCENSRIFPQHTFYVNIFCTVRKFHDFSITNILRENNFGDSKSAKSAIWSTFRGSEFWFYDVLHFYQIMKSQSPRKAKTARLELLNSPMLISHKIWMTE